jgi:hypothetical protein
VAGIVFVVLFIVGVVLQADAPTHDKPASEIAAWFTDHGKQSIVGDYMFGLGFVLFFLPFLVALRGLLHAAEGGAAVWSRLALVGGVVLVVLAGVVGSFWGSLAYGFGVTGEGDEAAVHTLMYLDFYIGQGSASLAVALFLLASSAAIWRTAALWRWLALLGLVAGVIAAIAPLSLLDADPEGPLAIMGGIAVYIGWPLWVLLASVAMIMKRSLPTAST